MSECVFGRFSGRRSEVGRGSGLCIHVCVCVCVRVCVARVSLCVGVSMYALTTSVDVYGLVVASIAVATFAVGRVG